MLAFTPLTRWFAHGWQAREYHDDLRKDDKTGQVHCFLSRLLPNLHKHGDSLSPVQGVEYVNELLARLTGRPVRDKTQTNRILIHSHFYADFYHDNQGTPLFWRAVNHRQTGPGANNESAGSRPFLDGWSRAVMMAPASLEFRAWCERGWLSAFVERQAPRAPKS